jgi:hypothetical protein
VGRRASAGDREAALEVLSALYAEVDARARELVAGHGARIRCGPGCADCCVDGLTVFEVEAELIRRRHSELLDGGASHPPGACAFLDLGGRRRCRIYADRPYVCRTQGLPLRWFDEVEAERGSRRGRVVERRDVCPLNLEGPALEDLDAGECWLLGPDEERLAVLEERFSVGERRRVALLLLFRA